MKYYVDYGTGAGNFVSDKALEETKREAENNMCYTQKDVTIYEVSDNFSTSSLEWALGPRVAAISFFVMACYADLYDGEPIAWFGPSYCYTAWQPWETLGCL